jgi:phosphoribosyl-AMP cyclohydrolase
VAAFPPPGSKQELEQGAILTPRFGPDGLIAAIATHADTGARSCFYRLMEGGALRRTD